MFLKDYKHGSSPEKVCGRNIHSLLLTGHYGKRSSRTFLDINRTNVNENLETKSFPLLVLIHLRCLSKVKVVSFLAGLMLTFLIMASYVLTWDKKGLLMAALPSHFRPEAVPDVMQTEDVSSEGTLFNMTLLVGKIHQDQHRTRKVPHQKDVMATDPHQFSVIPRHFLPGIKSPCWYEEFSGEISADPYKRNRFSLRSKTFKDTCRRLKASFLQHLSHRDGKVLRLRCLPYFYIAGQPKCGTTDLFHRLLMLPEVQFNTLKEPHWWTRKRFGYIHFKKGFQERFPLEDYLDLFDLAAQNIQQGISGNSSGHHRALQIITGEASASTMWDNQAWSYLHGDTEQSEPPFMAQDFIHVIQPGARIIIMLRDPVERLYSDYLYFTMANKSAEDFHQKALESVQLFHCCLSERSLRSCVYNTSLFNTMPVRLTLGMYFVFFLDWVTVFNRDQILVLRLEDYAANLKGTMKEVFDFLDVGALSEELEVALTKRPMSNTRRAKDKSLGPMLQATRDLLSNFYQPFNQRLADVLSNKAFLWR